MSTDLTSTSPTRTGGPYQHLFTPLPVGPLTLANRVVFAAHLTNYARDGLPTEQHAAYYARRAAGGAGLIITEEHSTHPADRPYEKLIQGHRPDVIPGYRRITGAVHAHGVPVLAQLNHNGGQSSGMYSRLPVQAPSPVPDPLFREVPKPVDLDEIAEIVAGYARVARHCAEGGFDGVELQCSQSSIIRGFLSPATNQRTDGYGGALANRARLMLEVVAAVRAAIGPRLVLGVRLGGGELIEGGATLGEAVEVARMPGRSAFGALTRDLAAHARRAGVRLETSHPVHAGFLRDERPDAVVLATGAVPVQPAWAHGLPRVVDVRQVADGSARPEGTVVVLDELGFHQATSAAELLAGRGCAVEVITSAMVVGQDLGLTLDLELWTRKAHAQGVRQRTDVVVLDAAEDGAGRLELTLLHHPTGVSQRLACDWVACAVPPRAADELWHALRGAPFEVHRVGDCLAPRRAQAAVIEGERVGAAL